MYIRINDLDQILCSLNADELSKLIEAAKLRLIVVQHVTLNEDEMKVLRDGGRLRLIEAIKMLRERTGFGLKVAKEICEIYLNKLSMKKADEISRIRCESANQEVGLKG